MLGAVELVQQILRDPSTLSNFPELSGSTITYIEKLLNSTTKASSYSTVTSIAQVSPGLIKNANTVSLSQDWGVKLSTASHGHIINRPESLRFSGNSFLVSNNGASDSLGCSVLDFNFNLKAVVGKKSPMPDISAGEYSFVKDFNVNNSNARYYICCPDENVVHLYNSNNTSYVSSLGDGIAGIPDTGVNKLTQPVAIDFSSRRTYILCQSGTPAGATGSGFLAVFSPGHEFISIPVYHGKNSGTGRCYQGEISSPKDMFVYAEGDKDLVYILNGYDEVGVFNSQNGYALDTVYSIPSSFVGSNLGLTKITRDDKNLYITAKNIGKVIAIDLKTKNLVGSFGILADESAVGSDSTLGKFNGLSGIVVLNNQITVTENINSRIQSFGTSLLKEDGLYILFNPTHIPDTALLKTIAYDLAGTPVNKVFLIDMSSSSKDELTVLNAKERNIKYFQIKLVLEPINFSKQNSMYKVFPMYVLTE